MEHHIMDEKQWQMWEAEYKVQEYEIRVQALKQWKKELKEKERCIRDE